MWGEGQAPHGHRRRPTAGANTAITEATRLKAAQLHNGAHAAQRIQPSKAWPVTNLLVQVQPAWTAIQPSRTASTEQLPIGSSWVPGMADTLLSVQLSRLFAPTPAVHSPTGGI